MEGIGQRVRLCCKQLPTEPFSHLIFSSLPVTESSLKSGPYMDLLDKPSDKRGLWVAAQDLNFSVHSIVNFPSTQGCLSQTSSYVCTKVNRSATCLSARMMETRLTTNPSFKQLRECCDRLMKWPMSRRVEETGHDRSQDSKGFRSAPCAARL